MSTATGAELVTELWIGDDVRTAASGGTVPHYYPATGEHNADIPIGGEPEIEAAVAAAERALPAWDALGPSGRRDRLMRLAEVIDEWSAQFDAVAAPETGIPRKGFLWRHRLALEWIRYYAGWADKVGGDVTASSDNGSVEYTRFEPWGVVGIIITWNSPLLSLAMKIPAALAAGNTVVVKPSELTPFTPTLFARACAAAGIPPGVVNIVSGAREAGEALTAHPRVEKISFTGGSATASAMMRTGAAELKSFCFELGGKSANIVFDDADVAAAVRLASTELSNAGQSCKMGSRILLHDAVYDRFLDGLRAGLGRLAVGDPLDGATDMGPLVSAQAENRVLGMVEQAQQNGAKVVLGGGKPALATSFRNGYFVEPTVLTEVEPTTMIAQEEIFGPVFSVLRFGTEQEAVEIANCTRYGLSGYVHTRDLRRAHRVAARLKTGTVYLNEANRRNMGAPFGGYRHSGLGSEGGRAGLDEFLRAKTIGIA